MTLDIEDRLMLFLSSVADVDAAGANSDMVNNFRRNIQTDYFTQRYVNQAFREIWKKLHNHDSKLFPLERLIRESALFKASPFHKLNEQQVGAKVQILDAVDAALTVDEFDRSNDESQVDFSKERRWHRQNGTSQQHILRPLPDGKCRDHWIIVLTKRL